MSALAFVDALLRDTAALLVVKATVVLLLASGVVAVATGLSAAQRHTLRFAALASCVCLALSSPVAPEITVHAPPLARRTVPTAARSGIVVSAHFAEATAASTHRAPAGLPTRESIVRPLLASSPFAGHPLIAIWISGCVVLLLRHAVGLAGAIRLARRASVSRDIETTRELARAAAAIGVKREIFLAYSGDVESPIAFGVAKPVVLFPAAARTWSAARRRAVVVHEVAHVARGDWVSQTIGRAACAAFWFHPLVWRAFAQLRDDAECAVDDCVLQSGIPSVEYASHLLDLARRVNGAQLDLAGVGIAAAGHLQQRLVSMFDDKLSRAPVTPSARATTMAFALVMIGPLSSLRIATPAAPSRASFLAAPATHPAFGERSEAIMSRAATLRTMVVQETAPALPLPPIAVVGAAMPIANVVFGRVTPAERVHPDFSGKWTSDTTQLRTAEFVYSITDSVTITQTNNELSLEGRGHLVTAPWPQQLLATHNVFPSIRFDGVATSGYTVTGTRPTDVTAVAGWEGDTLVLVTDAEGGGQTLHTIGRFRLSADRQTLLNTNVSYVNDHSRWGTRTFILRRFVP